MAKTISDALLRYRGLRLALQTAADFTYLSIGWVLNNSMSEYPSTEVQLPLRDQQDSLCQTLVLLEGMH